MLAIFTAVAGNSLLYKCDCLPLPAATTATYCRADAALCIVVVVITDAGRGGDDDYTDDSPI